MSNMSRNEITRPGALSAPVCGPADGHAVGDLKRFASVTFDDFRTMAQDPSLSQYEKIGFPDEYRHGFAAQILSDIRRKLPALNGARKNVMEIGPGCSELPVMLAEVCRRKGHRLIFIDCAEMLAHLPEAAFIRKVAGQFPSSCEALIDEEAGAFDAIIAYSVLHYVMPGSDIFDFVDEALALLAPGGRLLLGDIPNVSKRKRFFASNTGRRFHRRFMHSDSDPSVNFNVLEPGKIDDAVILGLVMRAQSAGFDAYVLPQAETLPMANRRDDIVIIRP